MALYALEIQRVLQLRSLSFIHALACFKAVLQQLLLRSEYPCALCAIRKTVELEFSRFWLLYRHLSIAVGAVSDGFDAGQAYVSAARAGQLHNLMVELETSTALEGLYPFSGLYESAYLTIHYQLLYLRL